MIRPEKEVRDLLDVLNKCLDAQSKELDLSTMDGERFDEIAIVFNHNQQIITTLEWVLGDDTKISVSYGDEIDTRKN